jgi:hypothetical protein
MWRYALIEFNGKIYNMNGIYKVFIDGELVAEQKNKLTLLGRSNALKTMLGLVPSFAGSMGIGISSKSNGSTGEYLDMSDLDFSVGRYPVTAASLGTNTDEDVLVYTARITDPSRYYITEIGLYSNKLSSGFDNDNRVIFNFESGDPLKLSDGSYVTSDTSLVNTPYFVSDLSNYRIGDGALRLTQQDTVTFNDSVLDMSYVAPFDNFVLAAHFSGAYSVNVTFSDGTNNATYSFASASTGYKVISREKNDATGYAAVDWSKITSITIVNSASGTTILDGLRVKKYRTLDSVEGLVSRAALTTTGDNPTAIEKPSGSVIDVQYLLEMEMVT